MNTVQKWCWLKNLSSFSECQNVYSSNPAARINAGERMFLETKDVLKLYISFCCSFTFSFFFYRSRTSVWFDSRHAELLHHYHPPHIREHGVTQTVGVLWHTCNRNLNLSVVCKNINVNIHVHVFMPWHRGTSSSAAPTLTEKSAPQTVGRLWQVVWCRCCASVVTHCVFWDIFVFDVIWSSRFQRKRPASMNGNVMSRQASTFNLMVIFFFG